jgi:superfamily II DNA or RNA helicase
MPTQNDVYRYYIYEIYKTLKTYENLDLCKIFEYFICIKLTEEYGCQLYEYRDIPIEFKEENNMTINDTGIDCCNLTDTIVQCKLRKSIDFNSTSTFMGWQTVFDKVSKKTVIRWPNLVLARNDDSTLTSTMKLRSEVLIDKLYSRQEIIQYCNDIMKNPPKFEDTREPSNLVLRDYQTEAIDVIQRGQTNGKNVIISLPTGTGKNVIMTFSLNINQKTLILVPRIILMEQIQEEIIKHKPAYKKHIQMIGGGFNNYSNDFNITIVVYNSIGLIGDCSQFDNIFIDEGHHIMKPELYKLQDDDNKKTNSKNGSYIDTIRNLSKYNNNVLFSATIDEVNGYDYYHKDIREMINLKYLSDYTIHVPVFMKDSSDEKICRYLIEQNYIYTIIYCNTQKEGVSINAILNKIRPDISAYIDCHTSRTKRNKIINDYKNGKILYLVNIGVLTEGFDAPITRGVCFMHMPASQVKIIQCVGRMLRLHHLKSVSTVILPFSKKDNEATINKFIKTLARNDSRIRTTYNNKKNGGYIEITNAENDERGDNECEEDEIATEFDLIYTKIYDINGRLLNYDEIWDSRFEIFEQQCNEQKKMIKHTLKLEGFMIGEWLNRQKGFFNKGELSSYRKNKLLNNPYFKEWVEKQKPKPPKTKTRPFDIMFKLFEQECNKKNALITKFHVIDEHKIGNWFVSQKTKYKANKFTDDEKEKLQKNPYFKQWIDKEKKKTPQPKPFETMFEIFEKECEKQKRLIKKSHTVDDISIGAWLSNNKALYNREELSPEKKEKLLSNKYFKEWSQQEKKVVQEPNTLETFEEMFDLFESECKKQNRMIEKTHKAGNITIGTWITRQKSIYNNNKMPEDRKIKFLENEYFKNWVEFERKEKRTFDEKLQIFEEECAKQGKLIRSTHKVGDILIGSWMCDMKKDYNQNKITEDRKRKILSSPYFKEWIEFKKQ